MADITYRQVHKEIEQYISLLNGHAFTTSKIDREFNYASREAKRYRWQVLNEYVKAGKLKRMGVDRFRQIDQELVEIEWQKADVMNIVNVQWPMELEKYIKTYRQSICVIAGTPGSGKTAFLEHFVVKNMYNPMGVWLFNNDMSDEEIKERMDNTGIPIPVPPPFHTKDRDCNFADVIQPNGINVIDYLDLNSELYLIGEEIEAIYRKLEDGIALIGIQKKPGQAIGLGGIFSWKRAKLYMSLDQVKEGAELYHKLTIVKARGRTDPKVNPNGMEWKFKLIGGIKFWVKEMG